jgi:hypothetical protein
MHREAAEALDHARWMVRRKHEPSRLRIDRLAFGHASRWWNGTAIAKNAASPITA